MSKRAEICQKVASILVMHVDVSKSEMPVYVFGIRLLSRWWRPVMSGLASKWVRFASNETNPLIVKITFQYILARRTILKLILKKAEICPILGLFGAKSGIPVGAKGK